MDVTADTLVPNGADPTPGLERGAVAEPDVQRLAEIFAVTPEAVRLAVARVGTDFRRVQRELGGRR
jgi:hypothetical protein